MRPMHDGKGFTLIELMIVVVIIGILASVAVPRFLDYARDSRQAEAKPFLKQIYTLQQRHESRTGSYTTDISALEGGAELPGGGRYFTYSVTAHPSGFCLVATPNADGVEAGLSPQSLDAAGEFHESDGC